MRHLVAQIIMSMPALDPHDPAFKLIIKAIAFRAALAFQTASVNPGLGTAPTCSTDTRGQSVAIDTCIGAPGSHRPVLVVAPATEQPTSQAPAADQGAPARVGLGKDTVTVGFGGSAARRSAPGWPCRT
jgi:hypothetical protein